MAGRPEVWELRQQEVKKSWTWRDSSRRQEPSGSPCRMEWNTRGSARWQKSARTWEGGEQDLSLLLLQLRLKELDHLMCALGYSGQHTLEEGYWWIC